MESRSITQFAKSNWETWLKVNKEKGEVYVNFRDAYLPPKRMQIWKGEQRLNFSVLWEQAKVMDCESMCWFSVRFVDLSKTMICLFLFFIFIVF